MRKHLKAVLPWALVVLVVLGLGLWRGTRPEHQRLRVWEQSGNPGRYETRFSPMGTDARVVVAAESPEEARRMLRPAVEAVRRIDRLMSTYRPDSELNQLNQEAARRPVAVSPDTLATLKKAVEMSRLTGGAFDPTYSRLRELWRRAAHEGRPPSEEQIQDALAGVGYRNLAFRDGKVKYRRPGVQVDLGGIAKGYAIDAATRAMAAAGAATGLVDIGGDLRLLGLPESGGQWRIQVRPVEGMREDLILQLPACAVATSGDYARGLRIGEKWFSHIIDPRTGRPVERVPSATVVADDAAMADALATAISVLGPRKGVTLVDSLPGTECLILSRREDGALERHLSASFGSFVGE